MNARVKLRAADRAYFAACAADLLEEARANAGPATVETWTPKAAGEALVDALRWAHHAAGRVGPGGMVSARLPEAVLSL
ncbi:hypothetical protein EOM89_13555, partial [Candidatus Falkowbacteria bacterium]|nr:hypothetical protein [Candidatus Falkowbacteria bacterium]